MTTHNRAASKPSALSQVFIVEASAGSGKTYTLAKRYVSLLFAPSLPFKEIPLQSILAITFTNKAAFEMKERILEYLKKICLDRFDSRQERDDIMSALAGTPDEIRRKAAMTMRFLIENYNFFQVQTIDSFINALLSGCAFKLGLSAHFRIRHDRSEYVRFSLDKLIEEASAHKGLRAAFDRFLHQYLFLENRTGWFPKADIERIMERLLSYADTYASAFTRYEGSTQDLSDLKKDIAGSIRELALRPAEGTDKRFLAKLQSLTASGHPLFQIEDLAAFFDRAAYPVNKGFSVDDRVARLWEKLRSDLSTLCELEAFILFNCYIEIFDRFFLEFRRAAALDDVVFLSELNRQARFLFDAQFVTVPELYFRLASRFRDYLIDEFQDTSLLQWRNLFGLIEDGLSRGGTLFFVGDKKQAIYRFRGGEAMLFDQVQRQLGPFAQERTQLSMNWRSHAQIVEFNNQLFSQENLTRAINAINQRKRTRSLSLSDDDISDITDFFRDSTQTNREDKPAGLVRVEPIAGSDDDDNDFKVKDRLLALVNELHTRFEWRNIAILARSNEHVEQCAAWLIEANIPVESDRTLDIRRHPLIKELISLLKFLSSPIDDLSFASCILGDIFLAASKLDKDRVQEFLFSLGNAQAKTGRAAYYRQFRRDFPEVWDRIFEGLFTSVGFVPLYELAISCLHRLDVCANFPQYQGFFMKLLELIRAQEQEHPTLAEFLQFFDEAEREELYVDVSGSDAVSVLTIHKAKGLEFSAVVCPFVYLDVESGGTVVYPREDSLSLLRIKKEYTRFSPQLERIYRQEYKKAFIDELNSIYVAFTRPRDELHVFVPERNKGRFNYARELFKDAECAFGAPQPAAHKTPAVKPVMDIRAAVYRDWVPLLKTDYIPVHEVRSRAARLMGETLHAVFSFLGRLSLEDLSAQVRSAIARARTPVPFAVDEEQMHAQVMRLLSRRSWKPFFFSEGGEVFTEQEVVDPQGVTLRIDRLAVFKDEAWVVDFKSSARDIEAHRLQVRQYMSLVGNLYPQKKVRGFLLNFSAAHVEEVYGKGSDRRV